MTDENLLIADEITYVEGDFVIIAAKIDSNIEVFKININGKKALKYEDYYKSEFDYIVDRVIDKNESSYKEFSKKTRSLENYNSSSKKIQ